MNILPDRQKTRQTLPDGSYLCPVVVEFNSNARKVIRNRTAEDDMAEAALKKGGLLFSPLFPGIGPQREPEHRSVCHIWASRS